MSKNILFISEQLIKDRTVANDNIDTKLINPSIKYCQDVFIEPILGTTLFKKIRDDIDTTGTTTGNYKILLDDYITDCLLYYVLSELPIPLSVKFRNKGVMQQSSDNSISQDFDDLVKLSNWYRNKAEMYAQRAIKYLKENDTLFTEYLNYETDLDDIKPISRGYQTSIYLGGDNNCDDTPKNFEKHYQGNNYNPDA